MAFGGGRQSYLKRDDTAIEGKIRQRNRMPSGQRGPALAYGGSISKTAKTAVGSAVWRGSGVAKSSEVAGQASGPPAPIFVSHASQDAAVAYAIVENLEQHGIKCWIARNSKADE